MPLLLDVTPIDSMYAIYAYIDPLAPPQLIGIYGSPMESMGLVVAWKLLLVPQTSSCFRHTEVPSRSSGRAPLQRRSEPRGRSEARRRWSVWPLGQ